MNTDLDEKKQFKIKCKIRYFGSNKNTKKKDSKHFIDMFSINVFAT